MTIALPDRMLHVQLPDSWAKIPGCKPWAGTAPPDCYPLLKRAGIPCEAPPDSLFPMEKIEKAARRSEAYEWLWANPDEQQATGGFALTDYQRRAIQFGASRGAWNLFSPAGSGKTIVAILWALIKKGTVIIVTKANARVTIAREIKRCTSATPYIMRPGSKQRKKHRWSTVQAYMADAAKQGFRPIIVVGWEQLAERWPTLCALRATSVVFDESHKGKAPKRERWVLGTDGKPKGQDLNNMSQAAYKLAESAQRRLAMTATPVRNTLSDLWGQLTLTAPYSWGRTYSKFAQRYCDAKQGEYGWDVSGRSNVEELKLRMAYNTFVVSASEVQAQLPAKRRQILRIPPEQQNKPLPRTKEEQAAEREQEKRNPRERKLKDAASAKRTAAKDVVLEQITNGRGKVLVFTGRRRDAENLGSELERRAKVQTWVGHGGWTIDERRQMQDEFMEHPGPCILVATVQSFGESLNLQDCDALVCAMLPDTPGEVEQMEGRAYRLGMNRPCLIIYLLAQDTYDEDVAANLLDKLAAVEAVAGSTTVGGLSHSLRGLDRAEEVLKGIGSIFDGGGFDY